MTGNPSCQGDLQLSRFVRTQLVQRGEVQNEALKRVTLIDKGFLVGPVVEGGLIVSVTERRTRPEIDELVKAFEEVLS